ncbi:P pilus assembly/Cpx signaling pathway, periplasmic inhibitor/zinc-resistance associated protein [Oscillatoria sp. FACHB-1406]|uniref:Spy/CpxP family protein refolding chaperone n=1 Tax=Oscillatoria sp. FACHB-1406 TaxID=2692846 RepID=UPI00168344A1|nr:P pilus assembly/Cpx signaling pathway, periplasmic inhibitor/zinc-resistance associated protein [Oscillatoria sp. FACHB-1406]MBD2576108.1 P pilus assembly/Cpx signaling pathway, periplasmic inhibitor/zinc-resistance associated protein [Oscillatoria sp. FACHB-1406]
MKSKTKLLSIFAGSIALSCALSSTLPAFSQNNNPTTPPQHGRMHHPDLNLTDAQKAQMQQIHQEERSQIEAILTDAQKAQLQSERANRQQGQAGERRQPPQAGANGGRPPSPFASLNLTDEQRSQIEAIRRATKEKMDAVLTPEQRQQMEQHRQERQQRRQGNTQNPN